MKSALVLIAATVVGCARPGDRAFEALEGGVADLVALADRRDRGELDDAALSEALGRWERDHGRAIERLAREAARSAGPSERAELMDRWRVVSERLGARLSVISSPRTTLDE